MVFFDSSSAANAIIINYSDSYFLNTSTAGSAIINTLAGGKTIFEDNSDGGNAQLTTDSSSTVDFSLSSGPAGGHRLSVGSIAGTGTYLLGADQLTVGLKGISTSVSGPINGSGGSLVVGAGSLTLSHAFNTYSGGTKLEGGGTLDVAAIDAAGTGPISFAGKAKLLIESTALLGHVFTNNIDFFGKGDVLDLTGLRFHRGASATYHRAGHHLKVHSGHVTDTLNLFGPHGAHFAVASDGHGGTKVTLDPTHVVATVAALSPHDIGGEPLTTDGASSADHLGDFLFVA
jgi:hypothetical protein